MSTNELEKIAQQLPADLVFSLSRGNFHKLAARLNGLDSALDERALFAKVGADLAARLQERRRIVRGLMHLNTLGA